MAVERSNRPADLPEGVIEQRLNTVNSLYRLGTSFKVGKFLGPADKADQAPRNRDSKPPATRLRHIADAK